MVQRPKTSIVKTGKECRTYARMYQRIFFYLFNHLLVARNIVDVNFIVHGNGRSNVVEYPGKHHLPCRWIKSQLERRAKRNDPGYLRFTPQGVVYDKIAAQAQAKEKKRQL